MEIPVDSRPPYATAVQAEIELRWEDAARSFETVARQALSDGEAPLYVTMFHRAQELRRRVAGSDVGRAAAVAVRREIYREALARPMVKNDRSALRFLLQGRMQNLYVLTERPADAAMIPTTYEEDQKAYFKVLEEDGFTTYLALERFAAFRTDRLYSTTALVRNARAAMAAVEAVDARRYQRPLFALHAAYAELLPTATSSGDPFSARRYAMLAVNDAVPLRYNAVAASGFVLKGIAERRSGLFDLARGSFFQAQMLVKNGTDLGLTWPGFPLPTISRVANTMKGELAMRAFDTDVAETDWRACPVRPRNRNEGTDLGRESDFDSGLAPARAASWSMYGALDKAGPYVNAMQGKIIGDPVAAPVEEALSSAYWLVRAGDPKWRTKAPVVRRYAFPEYRVGAMRGYALAKAASGDVAGGRAALDEAIRFVEGEYPAVRERAALRLDKAHLLTVAEDEGAEVAWKLALDASWEAASLAVGEAGRAAAGTLVASAGNGYVDALVRADKVPLALSVFDATRARALQQTLADRNAPSWKRLREVVQGSEAAALLMAEARTAVARLQAELERRDLAVAEREALSRRLTDASQQLADASADLERYRPALAEAGRRAAQETARVTVEPDLRRLRPDTAVLGYAVTDDSLVILAARGGKAPIARRVAVTPSKIREIVGSFRALAQSHYTKSEGLAKTGRSLGDVMFPPAIRDYVKSAPRWVILPDRELWEAPLAAMRVTGLDGGAPIGLTRPLTLSFSFAGAFQRRGASMVGAAPAVFGDAQFGPGIARLKGTRVEAAAVAARYGVLAALGPDVTEAAFRRALGRSRMIHVATHGILDAGAPMASALLFTPGPRGAGPEDDGKFQVSETFAIDRVVADLVVLSGCETGRGRTTTGEGVVGLTRGFLAAGARSVVASLWLVDDRATAPFMTELHLAAKAGVPTDEAMRRAAIKVASKKGTANPYFWAPFFVVGGTDPRG